MNSSTISAAADSGVTRISPRLLWAIVFVAASLLYLATCQRTVSWQDSGEFQYRVLTGDYSGQLGLALAHPLYIAAGRAMLLVPIGDFPARLNFFSGLGLAVACANLACLTMLITRRTWIALSAAIMLGLAHTAWWLGTIAEVYTWSIAGFTAELWLLALLVSRPGWGKLAALAFVSGLGLAVHNFALLPLPVHIGVAVAMIYRRRLPAWSLGAAAIAWCVGASPYLVMIVEYAGREGLAAAVGSALFGDYREQVLGGVTAAGPLRKVNWALMGLNLLGPQVLFVAGLVVLKKRVGAWLAIPLWVLTAIQLLFVLRYDVPDQFTFFLPSLVMICLLAAVGLDYIAAAGARRRTVAIAIVIAYIVVIPWVYALLPVAAQKTGFAQRTRELPFRNEVRYWLTPWKQDETSAARFARAALAEAAPDGVIIADTTTAPPLRLVQRLEATAGDVTVQSQGGHPLPEYEADPLAFRTAVGQRRVFSASAVAPYIHPQLINDAEFERRADRVLYRVRWRVNSVGENGRFSAQAANGIIKTNEVPTDAPP